MTDEISLDCARCRHFYVTWDARRPRGCRAYGFKSKQWPTQIVERMSGNPCELFELKQLRQRGGGSSQPRRRRST